MTISFEEKCKPTLNEWLGKANDFPQSQIKIRTLTTYKR